MRDYFVHETSIVDEDVSIGENTKVWHFSHIQKGARIGANCSLGQNVNISNNVIIGEGVKIQNNVSVYEGVTIEDYVFCGPSCVFTNDLTPRSRYPKNHKYLKTLVRHDATIGANCTIVCGHEVGHHATIAAGAVVTSNVPSYALMAGVPAKQIGWVCACGQVLEESNYSIDTFICPDCRRRYAKKSYSNTINEKGKVLRIYLDQNVYIKALDEEIDKEKLISYRKKNDFEFVYGAAHMEEIYRVASDSDSPYKEKMPELLKVIKDITASIELLPTSEGIIVKTEPPESCYRRVKEIDTTKRVEIDSILKFFIDTDNNKNMLDEDKHNQFISMLSAKEVWKNKTIEKLINDLNNDSVNIVNRYNNGNETNVLRLAGLDRHLNAGFNFRRGKYGARLQHCFDELEYTIEILMRVLNLCGYNSEKNERTAVSSAHDVTHCIYGTKCDYLITMDKRFAKRCEAVYEFIGADTKVFYCKTANYVMETLADISFDSYCESEGSKNSY